MSTTSDHHAGALRRTSIAGSLASLLACVAAGGPGKVGVTIEPGKASAPEVSSMSVRAPTSSTAPFSHFAQLGQVYLGGIVVRLHGATDGLAPLLRDLGLQDVTTRQCPDAETPVWLPGGTPRVAELFGPRGLQVSETVALDSAEGRAWRLAGCNMNPRTCQGSNLDAAPQP